MIMIRVVFSVIAVMLSLFASAAGRDKGHLADIESFYFYGVDFSMCKMYGVGADSASMEQLASINNLFVTEADKYDVERFARKRLEGSDVFKGIAMSKSGAPSSIVTNNKSYQLDSNLVMQKVADMMLEETKGTGLVLFCEMLDKEDKIGIYKIVFFDIESRSIIRSWYRSGDAGGEGVRDYWAKSLYNAMKKMRKHKPSADFSGRPNN